eukprot:4719390-Pleurochrysis_carterae.AAC.1
MRCTSHDQPHACTLALVHGLAAATAAEERAPTFLMRSKTRKICSPQLLGCCARVCFSSFPYHAYARDGACAGTRWQVRRHMHILVLVRAHVRARALTSAAVRIPVVLNTCMYVCARWPALLVLGYVASTNTT